MVESVTSMIARDIREVRDYDNFVHKGRQHRESSHGTITENIEEMIQIHDQIERISLLRLEFLCTFWKKGTTISIDIGKISFTLFWLKQLWTCRYKTTMKRSRLSLSLCCRLLRGYHHIFFSIAKRKHKLYIWPLDHGSDACSAPRPRRYLCYGIHAPAGGISGHAQVSASSALNCRNRPNQHHLL